MSSEKMTLRQMTEMNIIMKMKMKNKSPLLMMKDTDALMFTTVVCGRMFIEVKVSYLYLVKLIKCLHGKQLGL